MSYEPVVPLQSAIFGGVPTGQPTPGPLPLSLPEAIQRGLRHNLAAVLGQETVQSAANLRRMVLSQFYPSLYAEISESQAQVNLKAYGFPSIPGMGYMVGPFSVFDSRMYLTQSVLDLKAIRQARSSSEMLTAANLSYRSIRDVVVLACGDLYLQAVAGKSRIDAARVQKQTAQELYDLATDLKTAGVAPGIDVLRAQVQFETQQQRLIVAENEFARKKLELARAIGLPLGQQFDLTDSLNYAALPRMTQDEAVQRAYRDRADYQSAQARVRAAEAAKKAAEAEHLPSLGAMANYGINGPGPGQSHGSYVLAVGLRIPIYEGGRTQVKIREAESALREQLAATEDLHGRIYYEVQSAFLNLQSADERVKVSSSTVKLAQEQLNQAQDRFRAGVAGNIEVTQAQEALSGATDTYINSLYAHNNAKARLALALGAAESSFLEFVRGR